jgi:uncharacterized protein YjbJ (UPF0337 family)
MNKDYRTDLEEAAANQTGGFINQLKGTVKSVVGGVLHYSGLQRSGAHDHAKGRLQQEYGDLKERESQLENELRNVEDGRI